jgi:hypothetical protein
MDVWANDHFDAQVFLAQSAGYQAAAPFPRAVFCDILSPNILRTIAAEFEQFDDMGTQFSTLYESGKATESDWRRLGPATRHVIGELNGGEFVTRSKG